MMIFSGLLFCFLMISGPCYAIWYNYNKNNVVESFWTLDSYIEFTNSKISKEQLIERCAIALYYAENWQGENSRWKWQDCSENYRECVRKKVRKILKEL